MPTKKSEIVNLAQLLAYGENKLAALQALYENYQDMFTQVFLSDDIRREQQLLESKFKKLQGLVTAWQTSSAADLAAVDLVAAVKNVDGLCAAAKRYEKGLIEYYKKHGARDSQVIRSVAAQVNVYFKNYKEHWQPEFNTLLRKKDYRAAAELLGGVHELDINIFDMRNFVQKRELQDKISKVGSWKSISQYDIPQIIMCRARVQGRRKLNNTLNNEIQELAKTVATRASTWQKNAPETEGMATESLATLDLIQELHKKTKGRDDNIRKNRRDLKTINTLELEEKNGANSR